MLHLEQCLKKEIERHDVVAAQLAGTRTDAQMRLALAGLQVQQAEEAQGRQAAAAAGTVGALHGAHEAEVARLARAHEEHATQGEREHDAEMEAERGARERQARQQSAAVQGLQVQTFLARRHSMGKVPPWQCPSSAPARDPATGRPATASGARASRLHGRPFHCVGPSRRQLEQRSDEKEAAGRAPEGSEQQVLDA